jgi:hypothetical protein
MARSPLVRRLLAVTPLLAVLRCGGGDLTLPSGGGGGGGSGPSAARSTVTADPSQIVPASGSSTITVTVLDTAGQPVQGAAVTLQASGSDISLTQPAGRTGTDGIATGALSSPTPGTKIVSAMVNDTLRLNQTAQVTVTPAPAPVMALLAGDGQSAPVGQAVPVRPAVRVTDSDGNGVAGIPVTFVVTGGGGSVSDAVQTTNSDGIARAGDWTLGPSAGTNTLEAQASGVQGSPVVFTAQAQAGGGGGGGGGGGTVDHFVFQVQPPGDVRKGEFFHVEVAMLDVDGNLVPLSGIQVYLGLFKEGDNSPNNSHLLGDRFRDSESGVVAFDVGVDKKGHYRLRALSDSLPGHLGESGPVPFLFSTSFEVH